MYHMMVGKPPLDKNPGKALTRDDFIVKALPDTYSPELRNIVIQMLSTNRSERPTAADLSVDVNQGMSLWREKTPEGRHCVVKGERGRT